MSEAQQQNPEENKGGGGKGHGRDRGRGRGRGGRGRSGRSDSGNNNIVDSSKEGKMQVNTSVANEDCPEVVADSLDTNDPNPNKQTMQWFEETLRNLGHFDPTLVSRAIHTSDGGEAAVADDQFASLTLWLEDQLIRTWSLEERMNLRTDFWNHINAYLDAIECPKAYFQNAVNVSDQTEAAAWRRSSHRIRVVHWMLAVATSEAYNETGEPSSESDQKSSSVPVSEDTKVSSINSSVKSTESCSSVSDKEHLSKLFPLGFSTGDEEVDDVLTKLRLEMLIQLEHDQLEVNSIVAEIQAITSRNAAPLKEVKKHKHKVIPPKPSKPERKGKQSDIINVEHNL